MISFSSFFLEKFPFFHQLRIGEGYSINSLEGLCLTVTLPIGCRTLSYCKRLNLSCMSYMRASTKIDQGSTSVNCSCIRCHLFSKNTQLKLIVFKHFHKVTFLHFQPFKRLFLFNNRFN